MRKQIDKSENLIIGSSGLLGKNLLNSFASIPDVVNKSDQLENQTSKKYDFIFHCAQASRPQQTKILDEEVLNYWTLNQPQAVLITFGSDALYDNSDSTKNETTYDAGDVLAPWREYALVKRQFYRDLCQIRDELGLSWHHFVITSMFGPHIRENHRNHLIPQLILGLMNSDYVDKTRFPVLSKRTTDDKLEHRVKIPYNPSFTREVLYAPDLIFNVKTCVNHGLGLNSPLNLGSSKCTTVYGFSEAVSLEFGIKNSLVFQFDATPSPNDVSRKFMNSDQARTLFRKNNIVYKDTSIESSIRLTKRWIEDNWQDWMQ